MKKNNLKKNLPTTDLIIRSALMEDLKKRHAQDKKLRIIEELGVNHGAARIDIAVVNGIMHGYEIKSDQDTLQRLPEQMNIFGAVFDKITLVVGISHLYSAINMVPDWWGIIIAKINIRGQVVFQSIRVPEDNKEQNKVSIARLLWREEALHILEEHDQAYGVRSKPREFVYKRLADILETDVLKKRVRNILIVSRGDWRFGLSPMLSGD
jgi:hypothetical protein